MIIILGLIILAAALVVGVAGVLGNGGSAHAVSHFSILGYHLTGSAGTLFLAGIVVGAAGLLGLYLLLTGARRTSRRHSTARRRLQQSRRETAAVSQERDDLIDQRETARAQATGQPVSGTDRRATPPRPADNRWSKLRGVRHWLAAAPAAGQSAAPVDRSAVEVPAGASDPDLAA